MPIKPFSSAVCRISLSCNVPTNLVLLDDFLESFGVSPALFQLLVLSSFSRYLMAAWPPPLFRLWTDTAKVRAVVRLKNFKTSLLLVVVDCKRLFWLYYLRAGRDAYIYPSWVFISRFLCVRCLERILRITSFMNLLSIGCAALRILCFIVVSY